MPKTIYCRDVGFECDGVIRAETEAEALRLAAEHAKEKHGIREMTQEIEEKVRSVMRDQPEIEP